MDDMLTMQVWHQSGYSIITVAGEIDIATAPELRERLAALADSGRPVIADLDQVSFIDVAGLRALAAAARLAAACGGSLHVVSAQHQVRRIFALTGLDRQLPLTRTRAGALAGQAAGPGGSTSAGQPAPSGGNGAGTRQERTPAVSEHRADIQQLSSLPSGFPGTGMAPGIPLTGCPEAADGLPGADHCERREVKVISDERRKRIHVLRRRTRPRRVRRGLRAARWPGRAAARR
jgi:anti-sigma B factor antagonist